MAKKKITIENALKNISGVPEYVTEESSNRITEFIKSALGGKRPLSKKEARDILRIYNTIQNVYPLTRTGIFYKMKEKYFIRAYKKGMAVLKG